MGDIRIISKGFCNMCGKSRNESLSKYKNIHLGESCFLLGNAPSINNTNLDLIKDEIVFTTNRMFDTHFTYYVTSNRWVVLEYFGTLCDIKKPIFMGSSASKAYKQMSKLNYRGFHNPICFKTNQKQQMWNSAPMSMNLEKGSNNGATVVIEALHLAYYMGFKTVYLLGCDCDFSKGGHFYNESQESYEHELSEVSRWIVAYEKCKDAYEADGREIINCNVGGKLEVFKRMELCEVC